MQELTVEVKVTVPDGIWMPRPSAWMRRDEGAGECTDISGGVIIVEQDDQDWRSELL